TPSRSARREVVHGLLLFQKRIVEASGEAVQFASSGQVDHLHGDVPTPSTPALNIIYTRSESSEGTAAKRRSVIGVCFGRPSFRRLVTEACREWATVDPRRARPTDERERRCGSRRRDSHRQSLAGKRLTHIVRRWHHPMLQALQIHAGGDWPEDDTTLVGLQ